MKTISKIGMLFLFALSMLSGYANDGNPQNPTPTIHLNWFTFEEGTAMYDVSYRILSCTPTSTPEIHLNVFNEDFNLTAVSFELKITDHTNNTSTVHTLSNYNIAYMEMQIADCGSTQFPLLKIALPQGYDPANTTVEITYL